MDNETNFLGVVICFARPDQSGCKCQYLSRIEQITSLVLSRPISFSRKDGREDPAQGIDLDRVS
jgi:hypothetical protein